jgi:ABC-2 type transport system ATP-binding protein/sodium transport system ATP-binding protein
MIEVHELTKRFVTGGREILAVDGVSFAVAPGEVYGLLGPNGAGKTTTLRMIVGLLEPDGGYAEVAGFRTSGAPDEVKARIGMVSAGDGVYPWLSVREMLLFFADLYGLEPRRARDNLRLLAGCWT